MSGTQRTELRWRTVEEEDAAQQRLFDEPTGWHAGHGEFRGLEFLHVRAKRIINEVPAASRVPFRFTINAYRGCSHACAYCAHGDTEILMADGTRQRIADVRPGDRVIGTVAKGPERHFAATEVLDHWQVTKPAIAIGLENGAELVASAEHRFLAPEGWIQVRHCSPGRRLVAAPAFGRRGIVGSPLKGRAPLRIRALEAAGAEVALYDITTGTGDFIADGVVSHNCFARPTHEYLNLNTGEDFDRKIVVKINAVERTRAEVASPKWGGDYIAMGTNTDPYQRCEGKYRLTRGIIEVLSQARNPFSILTKSTLVLRDLDVLAEAARRTEVHANFSIGTLDEEVWKATEPGTPHPRRRLEAVARLNEAGIPTGVLLAPILPGLSDAPDQVAAVARAAREAGAVSVSPIVLHLRPGVREHYLGWLGERRPDLIPLYRELYPRSYAAKAVQERITAPARTADIP